MDPRLEQARYINYDRRLSDDALTDDYDESFMETQLANLVSKSESSKSKKEMLLYASTLSQLRIVST